jgi:hypothetical protein
MQGMRSGAGVNVAMAESPRRFPPPWRAEPIPGGYVVLDANGQALTYLYSRDNPTEALQAKILTKRRDGRCQYRAVAGATSRLRKKVLRRCRYATLIQIRSRWRTKDSIERRFGFECCASSTFL